jgi:transposase
MTFTYTIDSKTRFIVLYQDAQMKVSKISKTIGVPLRTIQDWVKKLGEDIDIFLHESKNFSQKIDEETRISIRMEVEENSRQASTRKLAAKYDVSHTAVRDVLADDGFEFRKPEKKHNLTDDEMEDRVLYCQDMLKYKARKIKRCFFSDEMGIRLTDLYRSKKLWMRPGEEPYTERFDRSIKVNCWGGISWNGATSLHIYLENLNNSLYQAIVSNHKLEMENLYEDQDFWYQQDNHPTHYPLHVFDDDDHIDFIDFPTYSPDLNPIENLWATLKGRVAQDAPTTEDELVTSLRYNWGEITKVEFLRPYLKTLEGRYRECIEKNGESLHH